MPFYALVNAVYGRSVAGRKKQVDDKHCREAEADKKIDNIKNLEFRGAASVLRNLLQKGPIRSKDKIDNKSQFEPCGDETCQRNYAEQSNLPQRDC